MGPVVPFLIFVVHSLFALGKTMKQISQSEVARRTFLRQTGIGSVALA